MNKLNRRLHAVHNQADITEQIERRDGASQEAKD
jgi:hypothetical protein